MAFMSRHDENLELHLGIDRFRIRPRLIELLGAES